MIASTKFTGETLAWFDEGDRDEALEPQESAHRSPYRRAVMFLALAASFGFLALVIARALA